MKPEEVLEALRLGKDIEYNYLGGDWVIYNQVSPVGALTSGEYSFRIKEMITIGNISFPKTETNVPDVGTTYYTPVLGNSSNKYIKYFN